MKFRTSVLEIVPPPGWPAVTRSIAKAVERLASGRGQL
jgi:hypothetical protein